MKKNHSHPEGTYEVRGISIPGRFLLAPINTGFVSNGIPLDQLVRFHAERSGRHISISYVGNVSIHRDYVNSDVTGFLQSSSKWGEVADVIRKNGSVAGIQLACQMAAAAPLKKWRNPDPMGFVVRERNKISSLGPEEFKRVHNHFVESAQLANDFGFQLVQLHAAHGYLLSKLLNPHMNTRTDEFGNGANYIGNIVDAIRTKVPSLIVDVRLSLTDGIDDVEIELVRLRQSAKKIVEAGADMISLSNGMYDIDRFAIYPDSTAKHGCYVEQAAGMAVEFQDAIWNVAGNVRDLSQLPQTPENLTFGIGRSLIADPEFIAKTINRDSPAIRQCSRFGHCHYFTRGVKHIECGVNPNLAYLTKSPD